MLLLTDAKTHCGIMGTGMGATEDGFAVRAKLLRLAARGQISLHLFVSCVTLGK